MSGSTVTASQSPLRAPFQFDGHQRVHAEVEHANVDAGRFVNTSQRRQTSVRTKSVKMSSRSTSAISAKRCSSASAASVLEPTEDIRARVPKSARNGRSRLASCNGFIFDQSTRAIIFAWRPSAMSSRGGPAPHPPTTAGGRSPRRIAWSPGLSYASHSRCPN